MSCHVMSRLSYGELKFNTRVSNTHTHKMETRITVTTTNIKRTLSKVVAVDADFKRVTKIVEITKTTYSAKSLSETRCPICGSPSFSSFPRCWSKHLGLEEEYDNRKRLCVVCLRKRCEQKGFCLTGQDDLVVKMIMIGEEHSKKDPEHEKLFLFRDRDSCAYCCGIVNFDLIQ